MTAQTPNFKLNLPDFDLRVWHTLINEDMSIIDAVLQNYLSVQNLAGVWRNSTAYSVGQKAIDVDQGVIYQCLLANTSPPAGTTFTQERSNNPSYWGGITTVEKFRGNWLANTSYAPRDFIVSGNIYAVCLTAHTSNSLGVFGNDAVYWTYLVNLTGINPPALAGNATKYVRVNVTETSLEYRTPAQVYADIGVPVSVAGPGASTNGNIATWSGAGGTVLADGGIAASNLARLGNINTFTNVNIFTNTSSGSFVLQSTQAGGVIVEPVISLQRVKAGAGVTGDTIGGIALQGKNSSSGPVIFSGINGKIADASAGAEYGELHITTVVNGSALLDRLIVGSGAYTTNATGGDKGLDSFNAHLLYLDGIAVSGNTWRNTLINGDMEVWNRAAGGSGSVAVTGGTGIIFTLDRWWSFTSAGQATTVSQQPGLTNNSRYCARIQRNAGQTGVAGCIFAQSYTSDMILPLRGKIVTVSAKVRSGANWSPVSGALSVTLTTGTGAEAKNAGGFTGSVTVLSGSINLGVSSAVLTLAVTSLVVLPANATQCEVQFGYAPTGTAGANDYVEIDEVQIEPWPVTTAFDRVPFDIELVRCQRFFWKSFDYTVAPAQNAGTANAVSFLARTPGATTMLGAWALPTPMRIAPVVTFFNPSAVNGQLRDVINSVDCAATTQGIIAGSKLLSINATGNAATTTGALLAVHATADAEL